MGGIGGPELLIVFVVILVIFGPKKIPEVARGIGKGVHELRRLSTEFQREINLADVDSELKQSNRPKHSSPGGFSRPSTAPGSPADPGGPAETEGPTKTEGPAEPPESGKSAP